MYIYPFLTWTFPYHSCVITRSRQITQTSATTHTDIILRARSLDIPVRVIHNASIMNAVGACGLQLYNFGQTVSLVFFTETWKPDSFYDRIKENADLGMHTLVLLDIKVKEQSEENLARLVLALISRLGNLIIIQWA